MMEISFFKLFFLVDGFVVVPPWPRSSTGLLPFDRGRSPARDRGWEGTEHTLQHRGLCFTPPKLSCRKWSTLIQADILGQVFLLFMLLWLAVSERGAILAGVASWDRTKVWVMLQS